MISIAIVILNLVGQIKEEGVVGEEFNRVRTHLFVLNDSSQLK